MDKSTQLSSPPAYAANFLTSLSNSVDKQSTIFRSNINPSWTFLTDADGGTVTTIVFQMNASSNSSFGYPGSVASNIFIEILSGATVIDTFTHSSYDSDTMRVTLTGSAALSGSTTYSLKLDCTGCGNVGFDQSNTNATGWAFTSNYYNTGYPVLSLAGSNVAPVLAAIGDQAGNVDTALSITVSATDADGETPTFSVDALPAGLSLNTSTGVISGTPTTEGDTTVTITASDGSGGTDTETFTWSIAAPLNAAPVLTLIGDQTSTVGTAVILSLSATDSDDDTVTYAVNALPAGLTLNTTTGVISGTPTTAGSTSVTITIDDGNGAEDTETFTWTINDRADPLQEASVKQVVNIQNRQMLHVAHATVLTIKDRLSTLLTLPKDSLWNPSRQGINLKMNIAPELKQLLAQTGWLNQLNPSFDLFNNGWGIWTEGEVIAGSSKGGVDFDIGSVVFGADKRLNTDLTVGGAYRTSREDSKIGAVADIDSSYRSVNLYGSYVLQPEVYAQGALGLAAIRMRSARLYESAQITGKRNIKQLYLSSSLAHRTHYKTLILLPYAGLDMLFAKLGPYTESGSLAALRYHEQSAHTISTTFGVRGKYTLRKFYDNLSAKFHANYQGNIKSDSELKVNYAYKPESIFTEEVRMDAHSAWLAGIGLLYELGNAQLSAGVEHTEQINWGQNNRYHIMFRLEL